MASFDVASWIINYLEFYGRAIMKYLEYAQSCDIYQGTRKLSCRDEMLLNLVVVLQPLEKWVVTLKTLGSQFR
jgi:hypothetical protein